MARKQGLSILLGVWLDYLSEVTSRISNIPAIKHRLLLFQNLRSRRGADVEVINRALQNENDLLRFQLNDLICREKNQVKSSSPDFYQGTSIAWSLRFTD